MNPVHAAAAKSTRTVMAKTSKHLNGINQYIDHTILKPDLLMKQVKEGCEQAIEHQFAGLCLPPVYVKQANEKLSESKPKVITVVGFPLGYQKMGPKAEEARVALDDGADELDMVLNISAFKSGNKKYVQEDIESIAHLTHMNNKLIKVIIETSLLSEAEIQEACRLCANTKVDYVKTCTGFNGGGANVHDIQIMRKNLPSNTKIKAAGGIKDPNFAYQLIEAGADRLGTSSSLNLINHGHS